MKKMLMSIALPHRLQSCCEYSLILEAIDSGKISLTDSVAASENAVAMGGSQIWLEVGEKNDC